MSERGWGYKIGLYLWNVLGAFLVYGAVLLGFTLFGKGDDFTGSKVWIWAGLISFFGAGIGWHLRGLIERHRGKLK